MGPGRTSNSSDLTLRGVAARFGVLLAVLGAAAAIVSGCGSSAETAAADPDGPKPRGGTITIGMDQEPQCMNRLIQCGSMAATVMIWDSIFETTVTTDANGDYAPLLAEEVPTRENGLVKEVGKGMDVTLTLRSEARWSDGKPITCEDIRFTFENQMDERWQVISREGWELLSSIDCVGTRTAVYHFTEPYARYMSIVGTYVLPKHVLDGKNFNTFFNERINIASGPYEFDRWDRSVEVVVRRNENYWNAGKDDKPYIERMRYVFVADTNTLKIQLRTGEVDVISPPPDSTLEDELKTFPRGEYQIEPGVYWEQIAFNNAKAPTNDANVRHAIARSIDRDQIAKVVLKGQVEVLDSTLLPAKEEYYVPAWKDVKADPKEVARLLEASGYSRKGQYYAKDGKPLTVLFKTTSGNNLRLKVAQLIQQRLKTNGIKMDIAFEPPAVFFGQSTPQGNYGMALWAWSSGIDPSQYSLFSCESIPSEANNQEGQNNYRYCNEEVSRLLKQSDVTTDAAERSKIVHEVQRLMAKDMPLLPIFQRPDTLAFTDRMLGMDVNPIAGFVWNVTDWAVQQ